MTHSAHLPPTCPTFAVPPVATAPAIDALIAQGSPVAYSSSGGKDSSIMALAASVYLDKMHHQGPRVVLHAHLGEVEWAASQTQAQRLADRLGIELVVVQRPAGGLLARWHTRWANSVARYQRLETVTLIMPWSSASLKFCTSEQKSVPISTELTRRFPGQTIISVVGLRRGESTARAKIPIWQPDVRLQRKRAGTTGVLWYPIADWTTAEVFAYHEGAGFPLHEAYRLGASRVSCNFCILARRADLAVAAEEPTNHAAYRALVDLEASSAFAFQPQRWLGDVAPHLLDAEQRTRLVQAQAIARMRGAFEARIPSHLRYSAGWPTVMPTAAEAELLAGVRCGVAAAQGFSIAYTTDAAILARYAELMAAHAARQGGGA